MEHRIQKHTTLNTLKHRIHYFLGQQQETQFNVRSTFSLRNHQAEPPVLQSGNVESCAVGSEPH